MNKKAQADWEEIIKFIIILPILLAIIGAIFGVMSQLNKQCPACPACDCSSYQNNLTSCIGNLSNVSAELSQRPVEYIQNVTYINNTVYVDKPVYHDNPIGITIIIISSTLLIFLTVKLFTIKIKLPKEIEHKIKKLEDWIKIFKWISLAVTILILIKLIIIFFSF